MDIYFEFLMLKNWVFENGKFLKFKYQKILYTYWNLLNPNEFSWKIPFIILNLNVFNDFGKNDNV